MVRFLQQAAKDAALPDVWAGRLLCRHAHLNCAFAFMAGFIPDRAAIKTRLTQDETIDRPDLD